MGSTVIHAIPVACTSVGFRPWPVTRNAEYLKRVRVDLRGIHAIQGGLECTHKVASTGARGSRGGGVKRRGVKRFQKGSE